MAQLPRENHPDPAGNGAAHASSMAISPGVRRGRSRPVRVPSLGSSSPPRLPKWSSHRTARRSRTKSSAPLIRAFFASTAGIVWV